MYVTAVLMFVSTWTFTEAKKVSPEHSLIYGPGLNGNTVLPVKYFYIQAVDTKGKNYTESPGKEKFSFEINASNNHRVRAWREILDRNDGTFIVRFRLYESYTDLSVGVRYNGVHIKNSPFTVKGVSYHEQCYCPVSDGAKWAKDMSCAKSYKQIEEDLEPFPAVYLDDIFKKGVNQFGEHHALCYYSVIDNQIYRKCYGEHVGFAMFMDAWLLSLARKVQLPDMEFFSNLGDWPLSKRINVPIPIFSWCGSNETYDLVMPTYDLTESVLEALGRVSLDMLSVQGNTGPQWKEKIEKGFFRGRDSRQERLDLTVLGRSKPELFDVGLTNFFFFSHDENKYGPKNQHISFYEFFKYKYQLNVDGTVAAYRFPYLIAGDSVVLKQDSNYYEHFYHDLQPMVHYIPFKRDLSNIEERIIWAKSHDSEAKKIALAAQVYARDNLMSDKLFCYSYHLFKNYSTRLVQKPRVREGMEHIPQPTGHETVCNCLRKPLKTAKPKVTKTKKKKADNLQKQAHQEL